MRNKIVFAVLASSAAACNAVNAPAPTAQPTSPATAPSATSVSSTTAASGAGGASATASAGSGASNSSASANSTTATSSSSVGAGGMGPGSVGCNSSTKTCETCHDVQYNCFADYNTCAKHTANVCCGKEHAEQTALDKCMCQADVCFKYCPSLCQGSADDGGQLCFDCRVKAMNGVCKLEYADCDDTGN